RLCRKAKLAHEHGLDKRIRERDEIGVDVDAFELILEALEDDLVGHAGAAPRGNFDPRQRYNEGGAPGRRIAETLPYRTISRLFERRDKVVDQMRRREIRAQTLAPRGGHQRGVNAGNGVIPPRGAEALEIGA